MKISLVVTSIPKTLPVFASKYKELVFSSLRARSSRYEFEKECREVHAGEKDQKFPINKVRRRTTSFQYNVVLKHAC